MGSKKEKADITCKILMIGDSRVGKTSVMRRFTDNNFSDSFITTVGIDFRLRTVTIREKRVQAQVWDTAGQERFRSITTAYYRGAQAVIIAYDVTNRKSFEGIPSWIGSFRRWTNLDVIGMLIGNKCDLEQQRAVTKEDGKKLAKANGLLFCETSAKENINVEDMFMRVIDIVVVKEITKMQATQSQPRERKVVHEPPKRELNLRKSNEMKIKKECCHA